MNHLFFLLWQVGNAVTDDYHDYIGTFEYWWTHGLISDSTYRMLRKNCDFGSSQHPSLDCTNALLVAESERGNIDPYSIFTSPCNNTVSLNRNLRGHYVSSHNSFLCQAQASRGKRKKKTPLETFIYLFSVCYCSSVGLTI